MGGVCCKNGVGKQEEVYGSPPAPAEPASSGPAPAPAKGAAQACSNSELVKNLHQQQVVQQRSKESPLVTGTEPESASPLTAAANVIDAAHIVLHDGAQGARPGDVIDIPQMSMIRVATSAAPAVPEAPPEALSATPGSGPHPAFIAPSGSVAQESDLQPLPQPELESQTQAQTEPRTKPKPRASVDLGAQLPNNSPVLTKTVQAGEPAPRSSAAMCELPCIATQAAPDAATLQARRLTEAGVSNPSASMSQVTNATSTAEESVKVKVETTRRAAQQAGGATGDGSSSVSYCHSATSSQHPGSSIQQGAHTPPEPSSLLMGSSTAVQAPSAAGETAAATSSAVSYAGVESIEGAGSTPGPGKGAESGFMFGAPRLREHRKGKKKDVKRSKSQSSGSNASCAQQTPIGSEGICGSKASGSDVLAGGAAGGMGLPANGSSAQDATMMGSSAQDASLASMDMMGASTPAMGNAAAASTSVGGVPQGSSLGTAGSTPNGNGACNTDFRSINRRINKPTRNPAAVEGSVASRPSASRVRSNPSSSNAASSSVAVDGVERVGPSEPMAGGVPEVVPEGEGEGEGEGDEGEAGALERSSSDVSRRSSSEHLSIMSPPEGSDVENVLMLICNIFQLPVALVAAYRSANIFIRSTALRLTDDDQWRYSLAQWSMMNAYELRDVLIAPNASLDDRFREYYCVKNEPKVKFFMASPLRSSTGELLGTLCMADFKERTLELTNLLVVNNLQTMVIRQLERDMALAQERVENEVAKEKLQQEMMRALDHFEKCIMFVDTSKPGWEVLYTNMAWEHVTGIPREHVLGRLLTDNPRDSSSVPRVHVTGRPLQDFFMALGGASLDWSSTAAEVASRSEFTVHRVAVRQKPDKLVSLHLRLATESTPGELEGLLPKGLPGWVKARGNEAHNYFVFVEEANLQVRGGQSSTVYEALAKHVEKVPGLELSHLLGKGGFGSVYYGTWNGTPVAVKMIDNRLTKTNTEGVSLEALMGQELSHPNIVKTIKYVMRTTVNASSVSGSASRGGINSARNAAAGLHSRNREGLRAYSGGVITSRHGSRNVMMPVPGSSGAIGGGCANGGQTGHPTTGMMSYMTSAQPGLSGMTSAQMAAAADLTSASAMQHMNRMGTTVGSDATVAGGGSSLHSSHPVYGAGIEGSSGVPPREAALAAAAAAVAAVAALPEAQGSNHPGTTATSTTTSGLTAVGPASVQASSTSTAAGPPSLASAGGAPANVLDTSTAVTSHAHFTAVLVADHSASQDVPGAAATGRASRSLPPSAKMQPKMATPAEGMPSASLALTEQLPPLAAPAALAPSMTAAYPTDAPPPNLQHLTREQQQAAITSRFSLAFSNITSGGEVLVPGKGSHSPSLSSGCHTQQMHNAGSVGSGDDMGEVWIIMEFCDRGSLQDALDRGALKLRKPGGEMGETHLPMMVATACEVASALHYLHERGIVHGDLTAWNVMICTSQGGQQDRSGRNFVSKVADFGLSRTLDVKSKIKTRTYGTISHMPPECLISGIISKATDVFAFGVLLWQMYTGLRPWAGMNHGQIIYNVGMKNVQLLFPPGTPPAIADLSSSCTRTNPSDRPSFNEILEKLDNIRASLGL